MEGKVKAEEKEKSGTSSSATHVVIFPCPAQGHVNSMLKLAELLALSDLHVTFLNTEYIHNRLIRFGDVEALLASYPKLQFKTIPEHFTEEEHPGFGDRIGDVIDAINLHGKPHLRDILLSEKVRVNCLIVDGIFGGFTTDLARELGITIIHFRTISACCFWAYLCVPKLFESNELPIRGDEDMDRILMNTPGMENLLRCRDLPSFCRPNQKHANFLVDSIVFQSQQSLRADALILNTFDNLEGPVLSQIRLHFPKVFTLGPLHHHINLKKASATTFKNSLLEVDKSCIPWLDSQQPKSVIYVSFGSATLMTREQLLEIWHGLVNCKKRFLWVMRHDMVAGQVGDDRDHVVPVELKEGTEERGFIVGWAPQEEVLTHQAIGGFLTHSGWNSTLESIVAGVPMICWPYFADQQVNSRFVSEAWKLGLDMKDVCDREVVERMVLDLMEHKKEEFLRTAQEMAVLAHKSVTEGGSSYSNLDDLIRFVKSTSQENC